MWNAAKLGTLAWRVRCWWLSPSPPSEVILRELNKTSQQGYIPQLTASRARLFLNSRLCPHTAKVPPFRWHQSPFGLDSTPPLPAIVSERDFNCCNSSLTETQHSYLVCLLSGGYRQDDRLTVMKMCQPGFEWGEKAMHLKKKLWLVCDSLPGPPQHPVPWSVSVFRAISGWRRVEEKPQLDWRGLISTLQHSSFFSNTSPIKS